MPPKNTPLHDLEHGDQATRKATASRLAQDADGLAKAGGWDLLFAAACYATKAERQALLAPLDAFEQDSALLEELARNPKARAWVMTFTLWWGGSLQNVPRDLLLGELEGLDPDQEEDVEALKVALARIHRDAPKRSLSLAGLAPDVVIAAILTWEKADQ